MDAATKKWLSNNYRSILDINETAFKSILDNLETLMAVGAKSKADEYVSSLSSSTEESEDKLRSAIGWIATAAFTAVSSGKGDAKSQLLQLVDVDDHQIISDRLEQVLQVAAERKEQVSLAAQRGNSVKGLLPFFEELNATVELRALFESEVGNLGHLGRGDKIVALEPIASVRLVLDSGFPPETTFQVGRDGLDALIKSLIELRGRFDELVNFQRKGE